MSKFHLDRSANSVMFYFLDFGKKVKFFCKQVIEKSNFKKIINLIRMNQTEGG